MREPPLLQLAEGGVVTFRAGPRRPAVRLRLEQPCNDALTLWRAVDERDDSPALVKILQGVRVGPEQIARAEWEVRQFFNDEYLLPVQQLQQTGPYTFVARYEAFDGRPLDSLIRERCLTSVQKQVIFHQLLLAVSDVHQSGVDHGDLQPANVLVQLPSEGEQHWRPTLRLLDAGLRVLKVPRPEATNTTRALPYLSPEWLLADRSGTADANEAGPARTAGDLYALGQILYELSEGRTYWAARGWQSLDDLLVSLTFQGLAGGVIDDPVMGCDFLPNAAAMIEAMTRFDLAQRPATVEEVLKKFGYCVRPTFCLRNEGVGRSANTGALIPLFFDSGDVLRFGRFELAAGDRTISRAPFVEFARRDRDVYVTDLSAASETRLCDMPLVENRPTRIHHGDLLHVGQQQFRFVQVYRTCVGLGQ